MMGFKESQNRYRDVVEDQTELIARLGADGTLLFVNEVYCRFFGKTEEQLLGTRWQPRAMAEDVPMIEARLATLTPDNPLVMVENRIYSASSEVHWFQFANRGFFAANGTLLEIQCVGRDITRLKKTEEALRRSEERLNLALSGSQMGVWEWEIDRDLVYWSPECLVLFGVEEFAGTVDSFTRLVHPDDVVWVMESANRSLAEGTDFVAEFRVVRPDGELRWMSNRGRPSYDSAGKAVCLVGTVQDITDRKLSEERLARLHEKMGDLSAHLETVREQERLAISREIHDEIGQGLSVIKLDLAWLTNRTRRRAGPVSDRLAEMRETLDHLISKVQHITAELRPPLLDNLGLIAAMEWQVRDFRRRTGISCSFLAPTSIENLSGKVATAVMRILQEALTNVLRHAEASVVLVRLECSERTLRLEVSDNGIGITPEEIGSAASYGLMGMQERARLCHGKLSIQGKGEGGTSVILTIPVAKNLREEPPAA